MSSTKRITRSATSQGRGSNGKKEQSKHGSLWVPRKKQKHHHDQQPAQAASNTLVGLPEALLCYVFRFLTVQEHFTSLAHLALPLRRALFKRSAWPRELVIKEDSEGSIHLAKCINNVEFEAISTCGVVPTETLSKLGTLGFDLVRGCGPISLVYLANPYTRLLQGEDIELNEEVLAPVAKMKGLQAFALHRCPGSTDAGLIHLTGLPLMFLSIDGIFDQNQQFKISGATLTALAGMPLQNLSLILPNSVLQKGKGLADYIPSNLPLEIFLLGCTQLTDRCFEVIGSFSQLKSFTSCSPCISATGKGFSHLSKCSSLEEVAFTGLLGAFKEANLSRLCGLPIKRLSLGHSNITGVGLTALSEILLPIECLKLDALDLTDADLLALKGLRLTCLRIRQCQNITLGGLLALKGSSLNSLRISQCKNITPGALVALKSIMQMKVSDDF
eukprot:gb/GEZN01007191.1/.p1 GENE.gb/GEZN01007191.1/~~gb/GEZN01007191.1/.p1  ORF type:complete len:454 (-),score=56.87 gb/GEZN01007191.1/:206-1540(-)